MTEQPPRDVKPAVPPYEGRQTSAKPGGGADKGGEARTGGATAPTTEEQPASQAGERKT